MSADVVTAVNRLYCSLSVCAFSTCPTAWLSASTQKRKHDLAVGDKGEQDAANWFIEYINRFSKAWSV